MRSIARQVCEQLVNGNAFHPVDCSETKNDLYDSNRENYMQGFMQFKQSSILQIYTTAQKSLMLTRTAYIQ